MPASEPILSALERNWDMVDSALEGLDEAALARQPSDQCNSAAWILWHMNRVLDTFIHTRLRSMPQLWASEGWHQKYGMDDDPDERGVGWTAEQVSAWQAPSRDVQLGYYEAVKAAAREFISIHEFGGVGDQGSASAGARTALGRRRFGSGDVGQHIPRRPDRLLAWAIHRHGVAPLAPSGPVPVVTV